MAIRTHSGKVLLEALAHHRDSWVEKLTRPEPLEPSVRLAATCYRDAFSIALEIVSEAIPSIEKDCLELFEDMDEPTLATGWDTGAEEEREPSDATHAEWNRGPSFDEMRNAGRAA